MGGNGYPALLMNLIVWKGMADVGVWMELTYIIHKSGIRRRHGSKNLERDGINGDA